MSGKYCINILLKGKTVKKIGKDFEMNRERVRQILEKIKRKLAYIHTQNQADWYKENAR